MKSLFCKNEVFLLCHKDNRATERYKEAFQKRIFADPRAILEFVSSPLSNRLSENVKQRVAIAGVQIKQKWTTAGLVGKIFVLRKKTPLLI